jgi:hypothetical protein
MDETYLCLRRAIRGSPRLRLPPHWEIQSVQLTYLDRGSLSISDERDQIRDEVDRRQDSRSLPGTRRGTLYSDDTRTIEAARA